MDLLPVELGLGNLHNTGYAHGHHRFSSLEKFTKELTNLCDQQPSIVSLITFTNNQQEVERDYLIALGFSSERYNSNVHMHYIDVKNIGGMTDEEKAERARLEKERKKAAEEALAAKRAAYKYNAEGRRLNADGSIFRKPGELYVGDTIRYYSNIEWAMRTVKVVTIDESCSMVHRINGKKQWLYPGGYTLIERAK